MSGKLANWLTRAIAAKYHDNGYYLTWHKIVKNDKASWFLFYLRVNKLQHFSLGEQTRRTRFCVFLIDFKYRTF